MKQYEMNEETLRILKSNMNTELQVNLIACNIFKKLEYNFFN